MMLLNFLYIMAMLFLVIGLIILTAVIIRKLQSNNINFKHYLNKTKRLKIEEIIILDHKRKLMLIRRDDVEHLLLLGHDQELIIESNIKL